MKFKDLTGQKFGRLLVISLNSKSKHSKWNCICDCGNEKVVYGDKLKYGSSISCGCYRTERIKNAVTKHGQSGKRLYKIWIDMRNRCKNPLCRDFHYYGGRGIKVCDEWLNSYNAFRNWSYSNGYKDDLTIDRIDLNGDYSPNNCKWATRKEQLNNTRRTVFVKYNGKLYSITQLSELLSLPYFRLYNGLKKGNMSVEQAIEYAKKEVRYRRKKID